ncbi:UDP-N-acetylmuramoyl-L-alanyl-D-glutamate--2,6-diaminopimelate ligase [Bacillus sp. HMF5848]|uniref:UDP-N-acetylmuramoyl-L-alanyl-D-glutamate--2, 6-diaminopimelate ligase n=1 Tax=Bacillus sp. HMF5848 TaxID=2495421 RepID=UPI000F766709|nr:UDP-N-acetylmuramoyl-L-alanyl-D-glutamate--2,6-diaminopimelate ligase [Bacillus sp. HMF5848]RSK26596.1 UDP-N-acetylmuramoyl-L-alanyl-D-glutamate--2,6-diaminopimelate ligase [Bacillus sp. HMF5848]
MKLTELLSPLNLNKKVVPDIKIHNIEFRSKAVEKGDIFVAIKGIHDDGHKYIQHAISNGAVAVIGEKEIDDLPVPYIQVHDAREALGKMATVYFNTPSSKHGMIGITGTNGKTTTAYMLHHLLQSSQRSCSLISTVANYINGHEMNSTATTPNVLELQKMLQVSTDEFAVVEVSSHGLDQKRLEGVEFDFTIFTNLSHDHLDYHKTLEDYFLCKSKLFYKLKPNGIAVINSSCSWGKRLVDKLRGDGLNVYTYGVKDSDNLQLINDNKSTIKVKWLQNEWNVELPLPGIYNTHNALASILVALAIGVDVPSIQKAMKTFTGVPGRFEVHRHSSGITFIVDYAHTPDGLEKFLHTVKSFQPRKLIHIFGLRGNGDPSKRALMLETSIKHSDEVILTMDDLNGVKQASMSLELEALSTSYGKNKTQIITDRTRAIEYAWKNAKPGDFIVITGKGPELYKESFIIPTKTDSETVKYLFSEQFEP